MIAAAYSLAAFALVGVFSDAMKKSSSFPNAGRSFTAAAARNRALAISNMEIGLAYGIFAEPKKSQVLGGDVNSSISANAGDSSSSTNLDIPAHLIDREMSKWGYKRYEWNKRYKVL